MVGSQCRAQSFWFVLHFSYCSHHIGTVVINECNGIEIRVLCATIDHPVGLNFKSFDLKRSSEIFRSLHVKLLVHNAGNRREIYLLCYTRANLNFKELVLSLGSHRAKA